MVKREARTGKRRMKYPRLIRSLMNSSNRAQIVKDFKKDEQLFQSLGPE